MRPKHVPGQLLTLVALLMIGCAHGADRRDPAAATGWTSHAVPEARGEVKEIAGKRVQIRYGEEPFSTFTTNYEQWPTYSYTDTRVFSAPGRVTFFYEEGSSHPGRSSRNG